MGGFEIRWASGAKDDFDPRYVDEIPFELIENEGLTPEASHPMIGPRRGRWAVRCQVQRTGRTVELDYRNSANSRGDEIVLGVLRLEFPSDDLSGIPEVYWQESGTSALTIHMCKDRLIHSQLRLPIPGQREPPFQDLCQRRAPESPIWKYTVLYAQFESTHLARCICTKTLSQSSLCSVILPATDSEDIPFNRSFGNSLSPVIPSHIPRDIAPSLRCPDTLGAT